MRVSAAPARFVRERVCVKTFVRSSRRKATDCPPHFNSPSAGCSLPSTCRAYSVKASSAQALPWVVPQWAWLLFAHQVVRQPVNGGIVRPVMRPGQQADRLFARRAAKPSRQTRAGKSGRA